jgi:cupin fold WbuC family metalloprotein
MTLDVQLIDAPLIERITDQARRSPRGRLNHNFHRTLEENPNRLLNVLLEGSYITPHRHLDPPKAEAFLVLQGRAAFFIFDDGGAVCHSLTLGPAGSGADALGIDLAPGIWHTLAAVGGPAVCYEVKPGPYSAIDDKSFAPWAPREGDPGAAEYLAQLLAADQGMK